SALGPQQCRQQPVSAHGTLQLQPEKPPQEWRRVEWRVRLDGGAQYRILAAEKNKPAEVSGVPFSGRAAFQEETLSLRISPVGLADSGNYWTDIEDPSGTFTRRCFLVSVWEPVRPPRLEAHILHREQGWCNLSLGCSVPSAGNVSYQWSCSRDRPAALEDQPQLQLQVHGDNDPTVCQCNVSNPVSWSAASTGVVAACRGTAPGWALYLGLALAISVALFVTFYCWMKRRKAPPGGHDEQALTVYEEVGKAQTGRGPNGTREATMEGKTIYAAICTKTQGPSCPQEPESHTIYSTVQDTRKARFPHCSRSAQQSPSFRRKRLDPALVSTAYVEVT
ncbi:CD244 protein, partial [Psophia crepitans]|nr:CD244 protein [Psophia crepitans]